MTILPDFQTIRPASLAEAVKALSLNHSKLLSGGTDLLPNLRRGLGDPRILVDLTAVEGFAGLSISVDGTVRIGAGTSLEDIAENPAILKGWPVLARAASLVAGPTHRAAATIGGNLCQDTRCVFYNQSEWWREGNGWCLKYQGDKCHVVAKSDRCYATYHGDVAPALMVLEAVAVVAGPDGERRLPLAGLFCEVGQRHLTLGAGEILAAVEVPPLGEGWRAAYDKARVRDAIDFPLAGVAVALRRYGDTLAGLRLAITGTNSAPLPVDVSALAGSVWDGDAAEALGQLVRKTSNVLKTTIMPVRYRRRVLLALVRKLAGELWTKEG